MAMMMQAEQQGGGGRVAATGAGTGAGGGGGGQQKLRFRVVWASGEDPEAPATELNEHSPHTRGWASPRFCAYPQELVLALEGGGARVSQVQILSHQCKIATKIELFIGSGGSGGAGGDDDWQGARFQRLGYLSLDKNERSNYQARELKSVYIDARGKFLRLVVHSCFVNQYNLFAQVGIVAVNLLGEPLGGDGGSGSGLDGRAGGPGAGAGGGGGGSSYNHGRGINDLSFDMNFDAETAHTIRQIAEAKHRAVDAEDYMTAKKLKQAEQDLRNLGGRLAKLDVAKHQAVEMEDYDRAKLLKDQMDGLHQEIEAQIKDIDLADLIPPQFANSPARQGTSGAGRSPYAGSTPHAGATDYGNDDVPVGARPGSSSQHRSPKAGMEPSSGGSSLGSGRGAGGPGGPGADRSSGGDMEDFDERPVAGGAGGTDVFEHAAENAKEEDPFGGAGVGIGGGGGGAREVPADHPLAGIVGDISKLQEPADISVDTPELRPLVGVFGEYRVRCLLSKVWALREAFFEKALLMLPEIEGNPGIEQAFPVLAHVLREGTADKIAQVFFTSTKLLEESVDAATRARMSRTDVTTELDVVIATLILKLGDGQGRIRDAAKVALEHLASVDIVGAEPVGTQALRPLPRKQQTAWRPIQARLALLKGLADQYGLDASGLHVDSVMQFIKAHNAFAHSNGEVRDAARDLTVSMYLCAGEGAVMPHLSELRPKQLEEYREAFAGSAGGVMIPAGGEAAKIARRGSSVHEHAGAHANAMEHHAAAQQQRGRGRGRGRGGGSPRGGGRGPGAGGGGGGGGMSDSKLDAADGQYDDADDLEQSAPDYTACMFCSEPNPEGTEDALDIHYWKECPMLLSCTACEQVVEISGLAEHLLEECDSKAEYGLDDVTQLAFPRGELRDFQASSKCRAPPDGSAVCPLCYDFVPDTDEDWKQHLMERCARNPRRK